MTGTATCQQMECVGSDACTPACPTPDPPPVSAVAAPDGGRPTILVAEKLGAGGVEMLKQVRARLDAGTRSCAAACRGRALGQRLADSGMPSPLKVGNVECSYNLSKEELLAKVSLVDAIVIRSATRVSREVFEAAKGRLKVVGRAGVGIDNVDLAAASE